MRPLSTDDVPAIVELCPALPRHRLTESEIRAALFPDEQETWVYGQPGVGVVATARSGRQGFVRLLAVADAHRRRGVGRTLLEAAEQQLGDGGVTDVTLGADAPHHLWAGVPTDAAAMCCLAEAARYRRVGVNIDVDIPLASLPADPGGWRLADASDVDAVAAFCARHYPDWANEATRACAAGTLTLSFGGDHTAPGGDAEPTGFCAFDGNRRGGLGPVAVRPDLVGRGVGRATLLGALHTMRARGDDIAAVQWVGPLRPYVQLGGHISRTYLVYRKSL
jgi:GNAT superfamily N-acetyltransferase